MPQVIAIYHILSPNVALNYASNCRSLSLIITNYLILSLIVVVIMSQVIAIYRVSSQIISFYHQMSQLIMPQIVAVCR